MFWEGTRRNLLSRGT